MRFKFSSGSDSEILDIDISSYDDGKDRLRPCTSPTGFLSECGDTHMKINQEHSGKISSTHIIAFRAIPINACVLITCSPFVTPRRQCTIIEI